MLTPEQSENFKKQLIEQIESSFPEDKKEFAISQIESMDSEQLEKFLIKNRLLKKAGANTGVGHCVFCSIVFGDIKSHKIAENSKAIAVLEINPVSKGHAIIIPKEHITSEKELPPQVSELSKKVSSLIKKRLKPQEIKIENLNILGHEFINIIPVYDGESTSERKPTSPEELEDLQKILKKRSSKGQVQVKKNLIKSISRKIEERFWLPKRIP
ncbi:MAG: HIT domain-containing protein [Nanoarchaeota archaeon]